MISRIIAIRQMKKIFFFWNLFVKFLVLSEKKYYFYEFQKFWAYRNFCRPSKYTKMMAYCPKWFKISLKLLPKAPKT